MPIIMKLSIQNHDIKDIAKLSTLILVKMGLKCSLRGLKFQKFLGEHAPKSP